MPPPIYSCLRIGSCGLYQLLQCGGSLLASAILSALPPCFGVVRSAVSGLAQLFGFIFACLVTQVAVGDVNSGQRVTRDSATVGGL